MSIEGNLQGSSGTNTITGTWTPTVYGGTSAGTGTYVVQEGVYTQVGDVVHFSCHLNWSSHSGTGQLRISLPFTSANIANNYWIPSMYFDSITFSGIPQGIIAFNTNYIAMRYASSGAVAGTINVDPAGAIVCTGHFKV